MSAADNRKVNQNQSRVRHMSHVSVYLPCLVLALLCVSRVCGCRIGEYRVSIRMGEGVSAERAGRTVEMMSALVAALVQSSYRGYCSNAEGLQLQLLLWGCQV